MEETISQLNDILDGKRSADGATKDAQTWLMVSCQLLATEAASKKTKQDRAAFLDNIKNTQPLFYDDVVELAKQIFIKNKGK